MTAAQAVLSIQTNLRWFLKNYYLITESAGLASGPTLYYGGGLGYTDEDGELVFDRTQRRGRILGVLRRHNSKNFKLTTHQFRLLGTNAPLNACHIAVTAANTIGNFGAMPSHSVPRTPGSVMVTTLLNGCTFAMHSRLATVEMVHIQPIGTTPAALAGNVIANGAMAVHAGPIAAFGSGAGYDHTVEDVTVIGRCTGAGLWKVYAQVHTRQQRNILRVDKIFEG